MAFLIKIVAVVCCLLFPLTAGAASGGDLKRAAFAAYRAGNYEAAAELASKAIDAGDLIGRQLSETLGVLGSAYYRLDDYENALASYSEAIRHAPDFSQAYSSRGAVYNEIGEYDRAIADADMAIRLDPSSAPAYNNRCDSYRYKKEFRRALGDCNKAVQLLPNSGIVHLTRGQLYEAWGKSDQAIENFRRAYELQPDYSTIRKKAEQYGFARP